MVSSKLLHLATTSAFLVLKTAFHMVIGFHAQAFAFLSTSLNKDTCLAERDFLVFSVGPPLPESILFWDLCSETDAQFKYIKLAIPCEVWETQWHQDLK